jgi:hypothetical protein
LALRKDLRRLLFGRLSRWGVNNQRDGRSRNADLESVLLKGVLLERHSATSSSA